MGTSNIDSTEIAISANEFYNLMNSRRTVRRFTDEVVPIEVIKDCVKAAATAPSGANKQPWYFAVIQDQSMKEKIRLEAEKEEFKFYHKRQNKEWLQDLEHLKTNWEKPHLTEASALIVIFAKSFDESNLSKCYYSKESVGIATGILITALHRLGISTLTHTPSPMRFLNTVLKRPKNEKPFLILAIGHKNKSYELPNITRKKFEDICDVY